MLQTTDWYFTLIFFSGVFGLVVAGVLFFVNKTNTFSSRLLAAFLVCFSVLAINYALMTTRFYLSYPHFWRVFAWASLSFAPFGYLYVRSVLEQSYRFRRGDFLLFLPAILLTLNHVPYFLLPVEEKQAFLKKVVADPKLITRETEGILPPGIGIAVRLLLGVCCTFAQFSLLNRWKKKILNAKKQVEENNGTFKWLFFFSLVMSTFWLAVILEFFIHFTQVNDLNKTIVFTIAGTIFFVSVSLLVRPSILYGLTGWLQEPEAETPLVAAPSGEEITANLVADDSKRATLSEAQRRAFKAALEKHFEANHSFKKPGYTIGELSHELSIPSHLLSAFINQEYGKNFNELVNKYRVEYLAELLKTAPDHFQYTLEALGKIAGFNSRTAFIASMKKHTGMTPSEFFGKRG